MNNKVWMSVALAVFLVACKSAPVTPAKVEDKSGAANTSASTGTDSDANGIKEVNIDSNANNSDANNPLRDPNNILSKRNIYFDYNSDAVKAEFRPVVEAHAQYLKTHQDAKVILQGNTDERGTREYNLSLGQRRSVSVKKALNLLGVQDQQIETVSYGEEKASVNCTDEDCFQQNRRVDVVYQGE
jgi:peptidoglycan-associated lipoprotein